MPHHCIYFVATGEHHRRLCRMAVDSLYLQGFAGDVLIVTDAPWTPDHAPADRVTFRDAPAGDLDDFGAKKLKATTALTFAGSGYDAVLFLDCDTLAVKDPTPLLDRVAADPPHLYAAYTSNRRLMATGVARMDVVTDEERERYRDQPMVDSYAVGFVPTPDWIALMTAWAAANDAVPAAQRYRSDAHGLNVALLKSGRLDDVVFMGECERLNGRPLPGTVIAHYVYGQWVRMPGDFARLVAAAARAKGGAG